MGRGILIILACVLLGASVVWVGSVDDIPDVEAASEPPPLPPVGYIVARTDVHKGSILLTGQATARWRSDLSAPVSGRVTAVLPAALVGERVTTGTPLVRIEQYRYLANLQVAKHALAEAQSTLHQAQRKTDLATADWARVASQPDPGDLALHLPALRSARAGVAAAKAEVAAAQEDLNSTQVIAPFDGYVTARTVSPGQSVSAGDVLLSLSSDDILDISVSVGPHQWAQLDADLIGRLVPVFASGEQEIATARIRHIGQHIDARTKLRQIHLVLDEQQGSRVFAGETVTVRLPGRPIGSTIAIPEEAITRDGFVWHIDAADRLQRFAAEVVFRDAAQAVARVTDTRGWRIVILPLAGFVPGSSVTPIAAAEVTQ